MASPVRAFSRVGLCGCLFLAACSTPADSSEELSSAGEGGAGASGGGVRDDGSNGPVVEDAGAQGEDSGGDASDAEHCEEDVDIVFVMDVSTSMTGFLRKLADEILAVDRAVAALGVPSAPHYGLVVFVDDTRIERDGAPFADAVSLQSAFRNWAARTASNAQVDGVGRNESWTENSMDALYLAARSFQWRPQDSTLRLVIHTTDDTFWDGGYNNEVQMQHTYLETLEALREEKVRVYTYASPVGGEFGQTNVEAGWFADYQGHPAIPEGTDGGVFNIHQMMMGSVSLADAIEDIVYEDLCDPYDPPR